MTTISTNPLLIPHNLVKDDPSTIYPHAEHFLSDYCCLILLSSSHSLYVFLCKISIIAMELHLYLPFSYSENSTFFVVFSLFFGEFSTLFGVHYNFYYCCCKSYFTMSMRSAPLSSQKGLIIDLPMGYFPSFTINKLFS